MVSIIITQSRPTQRSRRNARI